MITETLFACTGASFLQSIMLFWIKPIIKNQHVYGGSMTHTFKSLLNSKDRFRLYRGYIPYVLKSSIGKTSDIVIYKSLCNTENDFSPMIAGVLSSTVKVSIMPLDTISNIYQVHGKNGYKYINGNLYRGTFAYGAIQGINSSCWLFSYSQLKTHSLFKNENLNHIYCGFFSSLITDIIVNPFRVIKTNKQVNSNNISYIDIVKSLQGSFYRGLKTRLLLNGINGSLFVLFWKNLEEVITYK